MKPAQRVESWSDIPDNMIEAFYAAVSNLREAMIPRDCDGDTAISVLMVDRRKYEGLQYQPVPYEAKAYQHFNGPKLSPDEEEDLNLKRMRIIRLNYEIASKALTRELTLQDYYAEINRNTKKKDTDKDEDKDKDTNS